MLSVSGAFAQPGTYYPNYFINQDFTGVETWPAGWSWGKDNTNYMGQNNGTPGSPNDNPFVVTPGCYHIISSGSGARGNELRFPSTSTSSFADQSVWVMEFDWQASALEVNGTKATGVTLLGPNSVGLHTSDGTFWAAVIAELYVYDPNGYFHLTNLDPIGTDASTGLPISGDISIPTPVGGAASGNNSTFFGRSGTDIPTADNLNKSTETKVQFFTGVWYHISCEMNFETQKVQKFSIYQIDDEGNSDTFTDLPFAAPWCAGASSAVDFDNRKVTEFDRISSWATRGSGGNGNVNHLYDNMQLYVWKESVGIADFSIKYVDRDGNSVKDPRVLANQQVLSTVWLTADDKTAFNDGLYYYFYDAEATHAANLANPQGGSDGESVVVDYATSTTNYLTVVFKKVPVIEGTYIWSGNASYKWDYLDENFNIAGGGADISYQPGNAVEFSRTDVTNKDISIDGTIELAGADMTISAPDYTITTPDIGRITGTGSLIINAPVTLAADNRLIGGAIINTDQAITIQNAAAATLFNTDLPEITLNLNAGALFNKPITGPGTGTLNANLISVSECASAITGFSTVNISLADRGRETSNSWTNPFTSTFSDNTQINVIDETNQDPIMYPATYAINSGSITNAKVHLGDNTRIILNGTPGANSTTTVSIGELTGTASSSLQGNCVGAAYDRILKYSIGSLNTDAVFEGSIIPQLSREPSRRSGSYYVWAPLTTEGDTVWYLPSTLQLEKVGTGTWTVGGKIIIPDEDSPSAITVSAGTLELLNDVETPDANIVTVTANAGGTLKTHGNFIGAYITTINGTMDGGAELGGAFNMVDPASVLKLNVHSFTDGDFDKIIALGDIAIKAGTININVGATVENQEINILETTEGNFDITDNIESGNVKVFVNGEDISANTVDTPIPADKTYMFYFDPDQGILGVKGTFTGLPEISVPTGKVVKSIEYYNLLGQKVTKDNLGVTLQKITYTDGSVHTDKVYNRIK